ncbi:unnamed protein product [Symbiodinium sp. CCMP2456]|nr:unnamed protein product [Symbiodinium sp. CCMP2456]
MTDGSMPRLQHQELVLTKPKPIVATAALKRRWPSVETHLRNPEGSSLYGFNCTVFVKCFHGSPSTPPVQPFARAGFGKSPRSASRSSFRRAPAGRSAVVPKRKRQIVIGYAMEDVRRCFTEVHGRGPRLLLTRHCEDREDCKVILEVAETSIQGPSGATGLLSGPEKVGDHFSDI